MIAAITIEPAIAGAATMADFRHRSTTGQRPMLPDSAPAAPKNSSASNEGQFAQPERPTPPQPEPTRRDPASQFAAAVISGALSPTPRSMNELLRRIGGSPIPVESQARLKDLIA